jgi:SOS response regulatory protein OraA/RecX
LISHEARGNKELSHELAKRIADEKLREEVLRYLR